MREQRPEPPPSFVEEYFVVSVGLETELYRELLREVTNLHRVLVDIRWGIPAPPPEERINGKDTLMFPW